MSLLRLMGIVGLLGIMSLAGRAGDAIGYFKDSQNNPQTNRLSQWFFLGAPEQFNVTNIITRDRFTKTSDSTGFVGVTNYVPGIYREEHQGTYGATTNWFNLPTTNGTVYFTDAAWSTVATNATSGSTMGYSQAAVNALLATKQTTNANLDGWAAVNTNAFQRTNANLTQWSGAPTNAFQGTNANLTGWTAIPTNAFYPSNNPAGFVTASGLTGKWDTNGNDASTTGFIGTTNLSDLRLKANNLIGVELRTNGSVLIGTNNIVAATTPSIAEGSGSIATGANAVVGGGQGGIADGIQSTVAGGFQNKASNTLSTVSGGNQNKATALYATVGGGSLNSASGISSVIAGGAGNSAVGGSAFIGGGGGNIASGVGAATVAGGNANTASASYSFVGGGINNTASGSYSAIPGGIGNTASADFSSVYGNNSTASGLGSSVLAGSNNQATASYSFAAGVNARANHQGSFVFSDSQLGSLASSPASDTFSIRALNGLYLNGAQLGTAIYSNGATAFDLAGTANISTNALVRTNDPRALRLTNTTNVFGGASLTLDGPLATTANTDWTSITNGVLALPSKQGATTYQPGIQFYNTNGTLMSSIHDNADHNGAAGNEFTFLSGNEMGFIPGESLSVANGAQGGVQEGYSGARANVFYFQYEDDGGSYSDGLSLGPGMGHSHRTQWRARTLAGNIAKPAIVGFADTNETLVYGLGAFGRLRFYTVSPELENTASKYTNDPGIWMGEMGTNSWYLRGTLVQERRTDTITSSPYALDFNKSQCSDVSVGTASAVTFYATNSTDAATNYEERVFLIRSLGYTPSFTWPANWSVATNANGALPTAMAPLQILEVRARSVGTGQSNKLATWTMFNDQSFAWDGDAQNFFGRVGAGVLTLTQSNAVNNLVLNAKSHGWWTACDGIYPFVGGVSNAHAMNLRSNACNITWTATGVTHDALGVSGDGSSGYGSLTNVLSTAVEHFALNSAHIFVYCGSNTVVAGVRIIGSTIGATRASIGANSGAWNTDGLNSSDNQTSMISTNDFRGPALVSRTDGTTQAFYHGSRSAGSGPGGGPTATGLPPQSLFILARNDSGSAGSFTAANLRGASFGGGMSASDWANMQTDWDTFNNALGRKVP